MTACECSRPKHANAECCDVCRRLDAERYAADRNRDSVATHVRNLLRRHYPDWVDGMDVREAVNDSASSTVLCRMHKAGEVEKRKVNGWINEYRLRRTA